MSSIFDPKATSALPDLPASRLVPPPTRARTVAYSIAVALVLVTVLAAFAPWVQSVRGAGRVIAYTPLERQQRIEAPIYGRVARWWVEEGSVVEKGDRIAEVVDNDPERLARLELQRDALQARLARYSERATSMADRVVAVEAAQEASVEAARAAVEVARDGVRGSEQKVEAARAALATALANLGRIRDLKDDGLASQRELELAQLSEAKARTDHDAAEAGLRQARSKLASKQAYLAKEQAGALAKARSAEASERSAQSDIEDARSKLAEIETKLARQRAQVVRAPRSGTIFRLVAREGGEQVKAGSPLALLVPDATKRAVELWVDGNDASLITEGRMVRLQFEGWPAVQFTGWPSVAVGTFGGRVAFVDATDDGKGDFRVVVVPDEDDQPWPSSRFLRQGVRAKGWFLLNEVRLGYELWRQFNGFPPSYSAPPPEGKAGASSSTKATTEAK